MLLICSLFVSVLQRRSQSAVDENMAEQFSNLRRTSRLGPRGLTVGPWPSQWSRTRPSEKPRAQHREAEASPSVSVLLADTGHDRARSDSQSSTALPRPEVRRCRTLPKGLVNQRQPLIMANQADRLLRQAGATRFSYGTGPHGAERHFAIGPNRHPRSAGAIGTTATQGSRERILNVPVRTSVRGHTHGRAA
jgi:hypothetical protein